MSALAFLKRFIARPTQVASLVPSSKAVTKKVADRFDFSQPRVFVEFGPGEGCHTRELLKRATPDSQFFLFELDPELARLLERQFAADRRVHVIHKDAATLTQELVPSRRPPVRLRPIRHPLQPARNRQEAPPAARGLRRARAGRIVRHLPGNG